MDFSKLAPWNWFKKEEEEKTNIVPVRKGSGGSEYPASIHDLHMEFDKLFDSLKRSLSTDWTGDSLLKSEWLKPSLDVASDDKEYSIKVELPGIDIENICIEYSENTLKIKGEKHQEKEEKDKDFYHMERSYGSFQRILDIPEDADSHNITSSYKDGVLSIKIPRKELPQKEKKTIEIKTES